VPAVRTDRCSSHTGAATVIPRGIEASATRALRIEGIQHVSRIADPPMRLARLAVALNSPAHHSCNLAAPRRISLPWAGDVEPCARRGKDPNLD